MASNENPDDLKPSKCGKEGCTCVHGIEIFQSPEEVAAYIMRLMEQEQKNLKEEKRKRYEALPVEEKIKILERKVKDRSDMINKLGYLVWENRKDITAIKKSVGMPFNTVDTHFGQEKEPEK
jgi:hypothetical protein